MAKKITAQKNPTDMCRLIEANALALLDQARLLRTLHTPAKTSAASNAVQRRLSRVKTCKQSGQ